MQNKTIGTILIVISIIVIILLFFFKEKFTSTIPPMSTNTAEPCAHQKLADILPYFYISITFLVVVMLLGLYIIFYKDKEKKAVEDYQDKITKRLEDIKKNDIKEDKFEVFLSALDEDEKKVVRAIREQDGITQATLRIRTGLSKTKLSFILSDLEKKEILTKVAKGRTNQVFLKKKI